MKRVLLFCFLLIGAFSYAQTPEYIIGPDGYGINNYTYNNRAMAPVFTSGNYLYAYTKKLVSTDTYRNFLVKIDLTTNDQYMYDYVLGGTADFYSPFAFTEYENFLFFRCGSRLYKLNKETDVITEFLNDCNYYFIFGNYLIYDNFSLGINYGTYVINLTTNSSTELLGVNNKKIYEIGAAYYDNGQLYFSGTYSNGGPKHNIYKYTAATNTLTSLKLCSVSTSSSDYPQDIRSVVRVGDNLIYTIKDSDYKYKWVSVNLSTGTLNPGFLFDTNHTSTAHTPFVLGGQLYIRKQNPGDLYISDGVSQPVNLGFTFNGGAFQNNYIVYQQHAYTLQTDTEFGSEIWRTDGTAAGTALFVDLNPGIGSSFTGHNLADIHNGMLYLVEVFGSMAKIYRTDGTAENTVALTQQGAFSRISQTVFIGDNLYFYGESSATGNGLYKLSLSTLGNPSFEQQPTLFFPNPVDTAVQFDRELSTVSVYDVTGKLLIEKESTPMLDVSFLANGIYIIKMTTDAGERLTRKMMVKH